MAKKTDSLLEGMERSKAKRSKAANEEAPVAGKRVLVAAHFDICVQKKLRELAWRNDTTVQSLIAEALNMLFAKNGEPQLAGPPPPLAPATAAVDEGAQA